MKKKHSTIKRKIKLFYRISLFILLFALIIVSYFSVVLSNKPKSFVFVDKKIAAYLSKNFNDRVKIRKSYVGITGYGNLKITMKDIDVQYKDQTGQDKKLSILQAETEFSPLDLILARFYPNDIKIINPDIVIDDLYNADFNQLSNQDQFPTELNDYVQAAKAGLAAIRDGKLAIKKFVIVNARITINNPNNSTQILLNESYTKISVKNNVLNFSSKNKIDIADDHINLTSDCRLDIEDFLKCNVEVDNLAISKLANIHPKLELLKKIEGSFNLVASLITKEGNLFDANFTISSSSGSFEFLDFFSKKTSFKNLIISGNADSKTSALYLSKISADLDQTKLLMSLLCSNYHDFKNQTLDFDINLKNLPGDNIEKLWPVFLSQNGIRDWVTKHIKGGIVTNAHTQFRLQENGQDTDLNSISASVNFNSLNLKYDDYFPQITNIDGTANFTIDGMKIALTNGNVLNSKITQGLVAIDNFHADNIWLKISGNSEGMAEDLLKHINYQAKFANQINQYFNGNASSNFNIDLPIDRDFGLKDVAIKVNSKIVNFNSSMIKGKLDINLAKTTASNNFVVNAKLDNTALKIDQLGVDKGPNIKSELGLVIVASGKKEIQIKNINLWQNNNKQSKIYQTTGSIAFESSPFNTTNLDLKNNFGKNNYHLQYSASKGSLTHHMLLKGKQLDLSGFIKNKSYLLVKNDNFANLDMQFDIKHLLLANNQKINSFHLSLGCNQRLCYNGFIIAGKGNNQPLVNIKIGNSNNDVSNITGSITDISYLILGFDLSNKISSGNTTINIQNKFINQRSIFEGELKIQDGITFGENAEVKKIYNNQLVSQVKDKIASNQKISFDQLKLEFLLDNYSLNIKSLIANNYTIGITAKGILNLKENSFNIKGMIIPGYFINNLFGIGKIPFIGGVVRGLLTGGEGGGLFGIKYEYTKSKDQTEPDFKTYKLSAFVPVTIRNLFD